MGVYLSSPITDKISSDCENSRLKCGASSMQGWRNSQEDAHNCCLEFDDNVSLFAVYDGHGGHEVAEYSSDHLPEFIRKTEAYSKGNFDDALKEAFLGFDETLKSDEVLEELKKIAARTKDSTSDQADCDDDCDEAADNLEKLKEEAVMPISDVVAQYTGGGHKTPALKRISGESLKPISPFLKAKASAANTPTSSGMSDISDNEVSSSNEVNLVNGIAETNGEIDSGECVSGSGEPVSTAEDSLPTSSSQNGEIKPEEGGAEPEPSSSSSPPNQGSGDSGTPVKKKESWLGKKRTASLVDSLLSADSSEESDSEEDESFQIGETAASSDEDENGDQEEEEEDEEEDELEEEDSDEEIEELEDTKCSEEPGLGSGCTAVVALVTKNEVYVANAGDSRAVLCRAGEAKDMSVDHKPEDAPEMERIVKAGGRVTDDGRVNGGLNLSRALGDHTYKQVDTLPATEQMIIALPDIRKEKIDLERDEFLVIACDGIWNSMTSQEVVDFIRPLLASGEKLSSICERLFDHCLAPDTMGDGTGCDNMTCVIVQFLNKKPNGEKNGKRLASPIKDIEAKKLKEETKEA